MKQYRVVGFDAKDERLYEVVIEAPNQAIARMMVLAPD
jgi:ribulose bisphosphate carboxylase small subunit